VEFVRRARHHPPTIHADLRHLPLKAEYFDAVWASASLIHLPFDDAKGAIGELARVAKVGAPVGISVMTGALRAGPTTCP
jgi:ubiquinone/menaquinone biosynthesis C-methylase UbiE